MWSRFRCSKTIKTTDENQIGDARRRSFNVNEEYLGAFRTKSYADFFMKAQQQLVNEVDDPTSSSSSQSNNTINNHTFADFLLEPAQETITTILDSSNFPPGNNNLKSLLSNYFEISAEASNLCSCLLKTINHIQSDHKFMQKVLDDDDYCSNHNMVSELGSISSILKNPFSNLEKLKFLRIRDEYSSILQHLKSKRKQVGRKMRLFKFASKASGVCVTAAFGLFAAAAVALARHTLTALVMGPAILSLPLKKKLMKKKMRFFRCGFLRKVGEQLDVAAKGIYIVNRDFDTISRLVWRLNDEIEHNKEMIRLCLDKREDGFSIKVLLKEMKKNNVGFGKQVKELEEHVYLCLVTINRARALVIKEIANSYS